jgi:uncharacterized membrane-anchored protein YhcB (DUF1043 family)
MAEHDWLVVGFIIGLLVGIPIGWLAAQLVTRQYPASVVFERDEQGRIVAIHYVPGAGRVG